jgi:hypothetical protein
MPLLKHAIDYALEGWPVIPLKGKIPATKHGSRDWTVMPEQIATMTWHGIGLCTGHLFFVLDIDGDDGRNSLTALIGDDQLPVTPTAKTKRGLHYYYLIPKGVEIRNRAAVRPGIDVRGIGGYVVAPPSPHPDGGTYSWILDWRTTDLADAPQWLMRALFPPQKRAKKKVDYSSDFRLESIPQVRVGQRNNRLFQIACRAFAKGKSHEDVLREIEWVNVNRCDEPLGDREVHGIVKSANAYRT